MPPVQGRLLSLNKQVDPHGGHLRDAQYFDDSRQCGTRRHRRRGPRRAARIGTFADQIGLGASLSSCIASTGERAPLHDRGKVLVQMALVLAGGGESCSDIEHLRAQDTLFGSVPSDTTVFRTFHELTTRDAMRSAPGIQEVRAKVWDDARHFGRPGRLRHRRVARRRAHRVKGAGRPHLQGRLRLPPDVLLRGSDRRGPGVGASSGQRDGQRGHRPRDACSTTRSTSSRARSHRATATATTPSGADRPIVVRADSAGCTTGFLSACAERNVSFFVTARSNAQLASAIYETSVIDGLWHAAVTTDGELRDGRRSAR